MLLISHRTHVPRAFLGSLLGADDPALGRDIDPFQPPPAGIFRISERRAEGEAREPSFDATGRPTRRPGRGRRDSYPGEEERHAIEARAAVVGERKPPGPGARPRRPRVAAASESRPGKAHDERIYDAARVVAPADVRRRGDTACIGTGPETPERRPRGGELADRRRAGNRRASRRRSTGSAR